MTGKAIVLWLSLLPTAALAQTALTEALAEVDEELVFDPLVVPEGMNERDGLDYAPHPFSWGVTPLGPMDAEACAYACSALNGKLIWPFEMQVAARPVQRHLIRLGYRSEAVWVDTGKGAQARPLPYDERAKAIRIRQTAYQPMCLCTGMVVD